MQKRAKRNGSAAIFLHLLSAFFLLCCATTRADAPLTVTGTAADPFTVLSQAHNVSTDGIYYFKINEVEFSTFVNTDGWVLVLRDDDQDTSTNPLNATSALSDISTGDILSPPALSTLRDAVETKFRLFGADGTDIINATSPDSRYIDAITDSQALYPGNLTVGTRTVTEHHAMAQTWTGTGASYMGVNKSIAYCKHDTQSSLAQALYHICSIPQTLFAKFNHNSGYVQGTTSSSFLELYVRAEEPFDITTAYATAAVATSDSLAYGITHELFNFGTWPNAVIDVSLDTYASCYYSNATTKIRVDVRLGTLHEISHRHYAATNFISDGLYGDGTSEVTTRANVYARHGLRLDGNKLLFVSYGNACGSTAKVTGGNYWVFDNYNHPPTIDNPIANQTATEDTAFSFQTPSHTFADDEDARTPSQLLHIGDPGVFNPSDINRRFSGIYNNDSPGTGYARSQLDSASAWSSASSSDQGQWIELQLPSDLPVYGVITQGRANALQWVSEFTASVIDSSDVETALAGGAAFSANSDRDSKVFVPLDIPAGSRWLRLTATAWTGHPSMRVGLAASSWLVPNGDSLSGTPLEGAEGATVYAIASDTRGDTTTDVFTVDATPVNDTPTVAHPVSDQNINEDSLFSVALPPTIFDDVDSGDSVTVTVTNKPDWLSFSGGNLSGTPTNNDIGDHTITVTGTDNSNTTVSDSFVVTVTNVNDAPTLNTVISDQSATEDVLFEFVLPAANFEDADSGDTIVLSISSTLPAWLSFNSNTGLLSGTPSNSDLATQSITVRATDSAALFVEDSFDIKFENVNDNPVVANPIPNQSTDEDSAFNFILPTSTFSDNDGDTLALTVTSTLPSWLSFNAGTATFSGTPLNADVADISITVQASDTSASVSDSFVLSVRNTNDAPTLTTAVTDQGASEDTAFSYIVPPATFEDVDLNDTLSYSAPTLPAWLSFSRATRTLSGTPSNNHVGNNAVVIRATDEAGAHIETAFDVVVGNINDAPTLDQGIPDQSATEDGAFTFNVPSNTFSDPDAGDTLSYTIVSGPSWLSISGSTLSGTPAQADVGETSVSLRATDTGSLSADTSFSLSVIEINDNAPVFSSATAISIDENTTGVLYTATANDADSGDSLSFTITGGHDDALFTLQQNTGVLSFLNSPDYESTDDADGDHIYELTVSATDAANNVASIALEITLVDVNDNAPSFSSPSVHLAPEGEGSTGLVVSTSDADSNDTVVYAIAGGDDAAHFDLHPNTGALSFAHPLDYEQPRDANTDNTYSLVLRARDAAANETTLALDVVLQDTNDNAPSLTSSGNVSIDENSVTLGYIATATDPDTGDTITYGIETGLDGALFSIDPNTGLLNFVTPPDFEAATDTDADNTYVLTLSATDSALLKSTATLAVTVVDLNDTSPIFVSSSTVSISEGNFSVGYTALASDPDGDDAPALSLRYTIDGGSDAALFSIVPTTGQVSFISAPDFEAPDDAGNDHVYNLRLRASDTASNSNVQDVVITLLDANDNAPNFTSLPTATMAEGTTGVFYTATATDPDSNDAVTFSIVDGNAAGLFSIDANSGVVSVSAVDFEFPGAGSSNNVYSLTLHGTDTGGLSKNYVLAITVSDVNDNPPTITSVDSVRVDENTTAIGYIASATDPDTNDTLSWGFGGGADDALFSIDNNTGALSFLSAPDAEAPADDGADNVYNITLRALDAAANSSDLAITVAVDNLNDNAPVFSSALTATIDEGNNSSPYTAVAVDADTDSLRYEIDSGADASMFSIDPTTGVLTFDHALDHEAPEDTDNDNVYNLVIAAIDQGALRTTHAVAITVNDLNDNAPSFSSGSALSLPESSITTGYTATSTDPDSADSVAYTLGGADASLFTLDAQGELSFLSAPNFEVPSDANGDNAYALMLTASDTASNTSSLAIVISVTDVNDQSPVFSSATVAAISEGSTANFYAAQASDGDAGDSVVFDLEGDDAGLFSIHAATGALKLRAPADFENPNDADGDGQYALVVRASDRIDHITELALVVNLRNINESPNVQPQTFNVGEFSDPGVAVGSLLGTDPENDALHWTLLTADSPFSLSDNGELSVSAELDFEAIASFNLSVQVSDDLLSDSTTVTVNLEDENEITRLVQNLPVNIAELSAEGITHAVLGREDYYNNAIAEANPQPSTMAQLQAIITRANTTAELVEGGSNTGDSAAAVVQTLSNAGVTDTDRDNAAAYQRAIENANPAPTSTAALQAIVNEVNTVQSILSTTEALQSGSGNTNTLKQILASLNTVPTVPDEMLVEFAAQIERADPTPATEAEIAALSTAFLERAANHPVVYLSLEQDGSQVQRLRPDGGPVTVKANIANPVPGLTVSYDWQSSEQQLLDHASVANPVTETLSFDPALLPPHEIIFARVTVLRNELRSDARLAIPIAEQGLEPESFTDSDSDGVLDIHEGELDASVDNSAANKLQTVLDHDLSFVMEADAAVTLRVGSLARAAQQSKAKITLEHMLEHFPDPATESITAVPTNDITGIEIFDFNITALPRAGASTSVVIPLEKSLQEDASYVKFHEATGWVPFVVDGLNRVRSAPAIAGNLGQCPPLGHGAYQDALIAGYACLELTLEDGGPNDADRLDSDGTVAADRGTNGNIKDPGAIVYTDESTDTEVDTGSSTTSIRTGIKGSGSLDIAALLLLYLLHVRRTCARINAKRSVSLKT